VRTANAVPARAPRAARASRLAHLAWVWQFSQDGSARQIRDVLAQHNLGVILKTHDATSWMGRYDHSADAVTGPRQIDRLASFFESGGVPFHAWANVNGRDPEEEASMAAQVLEAGARSLTLDVEPGPGFWAGGPEDARRLVGELRARQPDAYLSTAFDPRPWINEQVPFREFAAVSDELAPMIYWEDYGTRANLMNFAQRGIRVLSVGPELLINLAGAIARPYGLPLQPIGQGGTRDGWSNFLTHALGNAQTVSVWRFGVAPSAVWGLLRDAPPKNRYYDVESGDSLSSLASAWRTTVSALANLNGIADPDLLFIGQRLIIPR
jgi:LysM repeat protein